jgi:hypothetical protein
MAISLRVLMDKDPLRGGPLLYEIARSVPAGSSPKWTLA